VRKNDGIVLDQWTEHTFKPNLVYVHFAQTQAPHHEQVKKMKLGEQPECAADVHKLCSSLTNNFAIIECLQSDNLVCLLDELVANI